MGECVNDGRCPVSSWKNFSVFFNFQANPEFFKEFFCIRIRKPAEDIMQALGIFTVIFIRRKIGIGQVTTSVTGYQNFTTQRFILFNN